MVILAYSLVSPWLQQHCYGYVDLTKAFSVCTALSDQIVVRLNLIAVGAPEARRH